MKKPALRTCGLLLAGFLAAGTLLHAASPAPVTLFNGTDTRGWRTPAGDWKAVQAVAVPADAPATFKLAPGTGVLVNGDTGRTVNLVSAEEFGDAELHLEFCIPKGSNSGVYLMGRYEVQVYDSHGVAKDKYPGIECGGIYPRWTADRGEFEGHSPRVNASRPPGDWQAFDVLFRAPRFDASGRKIRNACFVKVVHNGEVIHENIELTGPTRAAVWESPADEKAAGPLMLQGDHGPVAYRNIRITPRTLD